MKTTNSIIDEYLLHLRSRGFPCIAAQAAVARNHVRCLVTSDMESAQDDRRILKFLHSFVDDYRKAETPYHSAAVIFRTPEIRDEWMFDRLLWTRLNALADLDHQMYAHDPRVDDDPESSRFSFSLKEEAFFIIGLHPASRRKARVFPYPTLVFNAHQEFEKLRKANRYETMKRAVRKRDMTYSGSVNPMLGDFGNASETRQYSGIHYKSDWKCPLRKKS
ncbi:MAG TPA: guanitoxin biosynthesis heme-dependent pre-guanitoxin N-hydroxylase GntA [Cyclobacteriaceae bacterium]|nr:guanitoxin biosynthesis heme-dependent pre-guanitoxin N-hydroxylase GntA [Cyclobacteriaceae bacterium]